MLVDIETSEAKVPDRAMAQILSMISKGKGIGHERIGKGMYLTNHWSTEHVIPVKNKYREKDGYVELPEDIPEFGVCDYPAQCIEKLKLEELDINVFVSFVRVSKAEQPPMGGWRWHKWGVYIGNQEPTTEYIHDEPDIQEVYTFHIYQPK
jgi:hypothetical protein